jgi:hypothetical protein
VNRVPGTAPEPLHVVFHGYWMRLQNSHDALDELNRDLQNGHKIAKLHRDGEAPIEFPTGYWRARARVVLHRLDPVVMEDAGSGAEVPGRWVIHTAPSPLGIVIEGVNKNLFTNLPRNLKNLVSGLRPNSGGRPSDYDRDEIKVEIGRRILGDRKDFLVDWPKNQAQLARDVKEWAKKQGLRVPDDSDDKKLPQLVSEVVKALKAVFG